MSDTRVKDIEKAREIVLNEENPLSLLERRDPLIALAMIETAGMRLKLLKITTNWENHVNKLVPGSAFRQAVEIATSEMSYEEMIQFFMEKNYLNCILSFTGPFLLKQIATDPIFLRNLQKDNVLAPILFHINPTAAAMMPEGIVKPLSPSSEAFMRLDKILTSGFDPNNMSLFEVDIIGVQTLLADEERMLQQLDFLEMELNAAIKKVNPSTNFPLEPLTEDNFRLFTKPYPKDSAKSFLFDFFQTWALKNDFLGMTRLTTGQSDQLFVQNLINALQFKDNMFDGEFHGAWTHLIQWYCIVNAYNNGQLYLNHSPATLYKEIGKNADEENRIWNRTFETPASKIKYSHDFRDVASFHKFLLNDPKFAQRCPTIQSMLYIRALKAEDKINPSMQSKK